MSNYIFIIFIVLLTIKITGAAQLSWIVTCIPLMIIGGIFLLNFILSLIVVWSNKLKSKKEE